MISLVLRYIADGKRGAKTLAGLCLEATTALLAKGK